MFGIGKKKQEEVQEYEYEKKLIEVSMYCFAFLLGVTVGVNLRDAGYRKVK